jgi:molybdopterin-binding protein
MRDSQLTAQQAATALGVAYSTLKQWIYRGRIKTVRTAGGHHRIPASELDRFLFRRNAKAKALPERRAAFRKISGRNQLVGRIVGLKVQGLLAQVALSIGGQRITALITADAAREMRLKVGETAAALIKSTEVMIIRP